MKKSNAHIIIEIIEYLSKSLVTKTIVNKTNGSITVSSIDTGEELNVTTSPYDTYVQIIDGTAEITLNEEKYKLSTGEGIIIPAHATQCFNAKEQFKMISTSIKSEFDD